MTYYLGQLSNGKLISRSTTRSDFTHAAVWPPRLAYGVPFGTSPQDARKNAEGSTPQAHLMDVEVTPVRVVDAEEYHAARQYAKAHNGMAPEAEPISGDHPTIHLSIRELNDRFRKSLGLDDLFNVCPGHVMLTPHVSDLTNHDRRKLLTAVMEFSDWANGNDPYAEHDFGAIGEYFWKIDYYNRTMDGGAEDPADHTGTVRVLTIMHRSEY